MSVFYLFHLLFVLFPLLLSAFGSLARVFAVMLSRLLLNASSGFRVPSPTYYLSVYLLVDFLDWIRTFISALTPKLYTIFIIILLLSIYVLNTLPPCYYFSL